MQRRINLCHHLLSQALPHNLQKWDRTAPSPMMDFGHFSANNQATKIPSYRNTHHNPARDTVERRGAVVGVHLVGGVPSSRWTCDCDLFGGRCNNHPFEFYRGSGFVSLSPFFIWIFLNAWWRFFCGVGGFKNEYNTMVSVHNSCYQQSTWASRLLSIR